MSISRDRTKLTPADCFALREEKARESAFYQPFRISACFSFGHLTTLLQHATLKEMISRSRSAETKSAQLKTIATDGIGSCLMTDESYWRVKIPTPKDGKGSGQAIDLIVQFSRDDFSFRPAFYYHVAIDQCSPVEDEAAAFKYYSPGTIYSNKRSIFRPDPEGFHRKQFAVTIEAKGSRNMWNNYLMYYDATFYVFYFSAQVTVPAGTNLGQIREIVIAHDKFLTSKDDTQRNLAKESLWNCLKQYNPVFQLPMPIDTTPGEAEMTPQQLRNIVENHLNEFEPSVRNLLLEALQSEMPFVAPTMEEGQTIFSDAATEVQPFVPSHQSADSERPEVDEDVPDEVLPFAFVSSNANNNLHLSPFYADSKESARSHSVFTMANLEHSPTLLHLDSAAVNPKPHSSHLPVPSKRKHSRLDTENNPVSSDLPLKTIIPPKRIRVSFKKSTTK